MQKPMLVLSLLFNAVLVACCLGAFVQLRNLYIDYRWHRTIATESSPATAYQRRDAAENITILFGDSRVSGWIPSPELPGSTVLNAGVGGQSTAEMLNRLQTDLLRLHPDTVVIQTGMNDLSASITRGIYDEQLIRDNLIVNLEQMLDAVHGIGARAILSPIVPARPLSPFRLLFWSNRLDELTTATNEQLQALAARTGTDWLDVNEAGFGGDQRDPELYQDTLHLKPAFYRGCNEALLDMVLSPGPQLSPG